MRYVMSIFLLALFVSVGSFAQSPDPSASPVPVAITAPVNVAVALPITAVAEPAAPPQWASNLLVAAQNFPIVGPYVSKALMYAGIVGTILTALVAFLLALSSALSGIASLSGLSSLVAKVEAFQSGPIMYYLKYFSMFNAQKSASPTATVIAAVEDVAKAA